MKKIFINLFFMIFILNFIFCESVNNYPFIKTKIINIGGEIGLIGWQTPVAGGPSGPSTWTISTTGKIYIPDRVNSRVNIYDLNMNYITTIIEKGKKKAHFTRYFKVDDDENIIYISTSIGLRKIDAKGEGIFTINKSNLSEQVLHQMNFFPIQKRIFYYNDENEIIMISEDGQIEQNNEAIKALTIINNNILPGNRSELNLSKSSNNVLKNIMNTSKYIILDTNMYNSSFRAVKNYFEEIKDVRQEVILKRGDTKSAAAKKNITFDIDNYGFKLIGYDNKNNSYWHAMELMNPSGIENHAIVIFSKYGELLDAFFFSQHRKDIGYNFELYETTNSIPAVAPNGDVYFMRGPIVDFSEATIENPDPKIKSDMVYTFWKVKCQW